MHNQMVTIFLAIILLTGGGQVGADIVILKSGEMFQTPRAWKENGIVNYHQDGQVIRVDEQTVERLIQSPAPVEDHPTPEQRPASDLPVPSDTPAAGQPIPPPPAAGDDIGHLGLKWGQSPSQVEGLALIGTDPAYGGVQQYSPKEQNHRFGRARVDNIFFGFWQGRLYTMLVEVSNFLDFMDLKAEAFRRYGEVGQDENNDERYRWTGKGSDRLLSFDYDSDTGYLWMRSQALHEMVKARYPQ